jgi:hypothetical protein
MAAPNIVNVTSIIAGYSAQIPSNTSANILLTNAAASNSVVKVNSIVITNVTDTIASTTVALNSSASGLGTSYRIAYNIYVPPNASLQLVDKGNFLYLTEDKSILITSGTASALEYVAVFETIS